MKFSLALVVFTATMAMALPHKHQRRRFGQEQAPAQIIGKASALFENGSDNGQIATFAGGSISLVLGAADPCGIYDLGDEMITFGKGQLNGDNLKQYVDIVREAVAVEKNFSPFSADPRASICLDATKPASEELRGVLPLVDPALQGADDANTKTKQLLEDIKAGTVDGAAQAQGKSVGQQMIDVIGFTDFQQSETLNNGGGAAAAGAGADAGGDAGADASAAAAAVDSAAGIAVGAGAAAASVEAAVGIAVGAGAAAASVEAGADAAAYNDAASGNEDAATIIARMETSMADLKAACANEGAGADAGADAAAAVAGGDAAAADAGGDAAAADAGDDAAAADDDADAAAADAGADAAANNDAAPAYAATVDASTAGAAPAAATGNLQKSTSALGGIPPPSVINDGSDRPFKVEDNDSFLNLAAALTRSCDVQANKCQNKFNSADRGDLQQGDCDNQRTVCNDANK